MKTIALPLSLLCVAMLVTPGIAAKKLTARQIMETQKERHKTSSEIEFQKMMLVDRKGNKELRELRRYNLETGKDIYKFLLIFLSPKDIRGTTLLTWQNENAEDDQWLYLPALGRKLKRMAKGSKKGSFMGTDFTYADLSPEPIDDNEYAKRNLKASKFGSSNPSPYPRSRRGAPTPRKSCACARTSSSPSTSSSTTPGGST